MTSLPSMVIIYFILSCSLVLKIIFGIKTKCEEGKTSFQNIKDTSLAPGQAGCCPISDDTSQLPVLLGKKPASGSGSGGEGALPCLV